MDNKNKRGILIGSILVILGVIMIIIGLLLKQGIL